MIELPRLLVLRVYADTSTTGYYSPLHPDSECASLLPIPEKELVKGPPSWLKPETVIDPCTGRPYSDFMPSDRYWVLHNDPNLYLGFYTDHPAPTGRIPSGLGEGDIVLFIAGLAVYPRGFWSKRRSFAEIVRAYRKARAGGLTGVYIVGWLVVENRIDVSRTGWSQAIEAEPVLLHSPHYWAEDQRTVALTGKGSVLQPPLRIDKEPGASLIKRVLGSGVFAKLAKNRFRKSRIVEISAGVEWVVRILEKSLPARGVGRGLGMAPRLF